MAERYDTKCNLKLGGFQSQHEASSVSSHTDELWYNETVCLWMTIYIYIEREREDLALNNPLELICLKTQQNQSYQLCMNQFVEEIHGQIRILTGFDKNTECNISLLMQAG